MKKSTFFFLELEITYVTINCLYKSETNDTNARKIDEKHTIKTLTMKFFSLNEAELKRSLRPRGCAGALLWWQLLVTRALLIRRSQLFLIGYHEPAHTDGL